MFYEIYFIKHYFFRYIHDIFFIFDLASAIPYYLQLLFKVNFFLTISLIQTNYIYSFTLPDDDRRRESLAGSNGENPRSNGKGHKDSIE